MGTGEAQRDFGRLWRAHAISAAGSALSAGALPLVAVVVLHASTLQVSLLATLSGLAGAALALPLGGLIEVRRKRPALVAADLLRGLATLSIPAAAAAGALTYAQLCCVAVLNTTCAIASLAAGTAYLKALLPPPLRIGAAARLDSTSWLAGSAGPPLGGALIGLFGPTATLGLDGLSFLASAGAVGAIRTAEPRPARPAARRLRADLAVGLRTILGHPGLRPLFWNAMLFGGAVTLVAPLLAVLMLRELRFAAWQYGLVLGLPSLGGALGAAVAPRLERRLGRRAMLLAAGTLRAPWLLLVPLAGRGAAGLAVLLAAETGLLFAAGVFNPAFAAYRMDAVGDDRIARVGTAWSIGSKVAQPLFVALGGAVATVAGVRLALGLGAVLCLASAALLPWRVEAAELVPAPQP